MKNFLKAFLNGIEQQMRTADISYAPNHPIKEGEVVIGTVTLTSTKILFGWRNHLLKEEAQAQIDAQFNSASEEEYKQKSNSLHRKQDLAELVTNLTWLAVREELNTWGTSVGIRSGWTIVIPIIPEDNDLKDLKELIKSSLKKAGIEMFSNNESEPDPDPTVN